MNLNAGIGPRSEPLVPAEDIATFLGVEIKTLYDWRRAGTGPPSYRTGKFLRYDWAEGKEWLASQRRAGDMTASPTDGNIPPLADGRIRGGFAWTHGGEHREVPDARPPR